MAGVITNDDGGEYLREMRRIEEEGGTAAPVESPLRRAKANTLAQTRSLLRAARSEVAALEARELHLMREIEQLDVIAACRLRL